MDSKPLDATAANEPADATAPRWLRLEPYVFGLGCAVVLFFLFAWPGDWPPGFFIDEVSVGYNARLIGHTLHDQHGALLPLYFKAFGDYKSPLYVYGAVLPELIFGPSKLAERLISTLYMLGASGVLFLLIRELTGRRLLARWLALLSLLVPSLFFYARGGFSEASCLPFWMLVALYAVLRFERVPSLRTAVGCGAAIGILTYAYTTSRLLAPLLLAAALIAFYRAGQPYRRFLPALAGAGALLGLPTAVFMLLHPTELSWRYRTMVSVFRDNPTPIAAASRIVQTYLQHLLSLDFLFRTGQHNAWHNVGEGFLPLWLYAPMILGAASLWSRRRTPFAQVLFILWIISPIPVALTWENLPHTSRYLHFAVIALILAALGISDALARARPAPSLVALFVLCALFEGGLMLRTSFIDYRESFGGGGGYDSGLADTLQKVFREKPKDAPLYLPDDFFDFDGLRIAYFADVPLDYREKIPRAQAWKRQFERMRIRNLKSVAEAGSGDWIVESRSNMPSQVVDCMATTSPPGSDGPLWSIYRVR